MVRDAFSRGTRATLGFGPKAQVKRAEGPELVEGARAQAWVRPPHHSKPRRGPARFARSSQVTIGTKCTTASTTSPKPPSFAVTPILIYAIFRCMNQATHSQPLTRAHPSPPYARVVGQNRTSPAGPHLAGDPNGRPGRDSVRECAQQLHKLHQFRNPRIPSR
jgi:hypothetical protein